jgi:hypothetical protein
MNSSINRVRASLAYKALRAFRDAGGQGDERTLILDLIADLGHLGAERRLDFVRIAAQALGVWAYERKTPEATGPSPQVCVAIAGRAPAYAWPRRELAACPEPPKKVSTPRAASGRLVTRAHSRRLTTGKDRP